MPIIRIIAIKISKYRPTFTMESPIWLKVLLSVANEKSLPVSK